MSKFDVFYTIANHDLDLVEQSITNNMKKIQGFNDTFVFNEFKKIEIKGTKNLENEFFPFNLESIAKQMKLKNRAGWVYAQLAKLYFPFLNDQSDFTLVVDCDVFFLKSIEFFKENKPIFTVSKEYHAPYFEHMNRLHPELERASKMSGISHHMMFNKHYLNEIFQKVENYHQKPFYQVYVEQINQNENSSSADYEIYFHYLYKNYQSDLVIRNLNWENVDLLSKKNLKDKDMVSLPHYKMTRPRNLFHNILKFKFRDAFCSLLNIFLIKRISKL